MKLNFSEGVSKLFQLYGESTLRVEGLKEVHFSQKEHYNANQTNCRRNKQKEKPKEGGGE